MHQQPDFDRPDVTDSNSESAAEKAQIHAEVDQTCNDLASKIKALEEKVLTPVHKVQDAVQSTVDAVQGTVHTAKEKVDNVRMQVSEHPWLAIGAGVVAGMIAGYVSANPARPLSGSRTRAPSGGYRAAGAANGHSGSVGNGAAAESPGAFSGVKSWFSEEFGKFKGIAMGAAIALARDFMKDQAPRFAQNIDEFMNDMTSKLGATPFKERLFENGSGLDSLKSLFGSAGRSRASGV
ncbi:MAG: hypothetical protein K2X38_06900 [Gemmataceae bacterium]|nr:hypothetical protein [Gemmataceae bacterium]